MQSVVKSYTGLTATGALPPIAIPDSARSFGLEVAVPSGVLTAWSVTLELSLDGVNWTPAVITHAANIGTTQWAIDKPATFMRVNVGTLTLNTAPSITVVVLAVP